MSESLLFHKTYTHPTSDEWVVFVHGAGGSSSIWFKQIRAYREHFNLLFIDLRGHGKSNQFLKDIMANKYTFKTVTMDIVRVLDHLKIQSAHFVGMSLGTIIVRNIAELAMPRVRSMVLGGAVTRFNTRSQILVKIGNMSKHIIPYMWLYSLFAYIVMPQRGQKESRHLFVREAKKLCQNEFKRWYRLTTEVNPLNRYFKERELPIPTLYLMGEKDYMFIKPVKEMVAEHKSSQLLEIKDCGHVCNVENPEEFNRHSIAFIKSVTPQ
ncbi:MULTISPECIES: alpha/beta fold hydrolase [Vibrio]|jgi:pimeloyl-ACP methyl ester carboxylesterase|uniref:2-succinyl-6-hydroxy-2, 4-cyclohexadiene-1-carboxylate synthase n=1 Tax=Vibrio mediterranei TaxID=689 RepID=A0A2C9P8N4_9VIBR|nr:MULTISPECIES: alpha/beta hydrolase [Vibrio]ASI88467.1 2-succinyl-6-hydroxy-2,4-cyclohexadiene-1-carboxylate synthase [Vibrio mediterranei]AYV20373.1 alpha/beta hydrolase [Vibrio mediterranei]EDL51419.1 beta-ketoadipate enol-lactone hydrolase, putative [Vibrio mediterranei AK1]KFA96665.1 2-succinyl-6-hydroxy-2,4-cyclohexadiene-1-carboxylate synthase [Vibrio sp. ER1A]MCG9627979.1 alpha/beta hydrolase [Vibrio mediterranei]